MATNRDEILAGAGSRYTYSANTLALDEAKEKGLSKLALVGMSCQSSVPPVMWSRKIGKISKPIVFNIGLLCSKTFDDAIFEELFEAKYRLPKSEIVKMNIKGVFQIWMRDGSYHEVNLKECHAWTREGCTHCPDFAAEHADISTGGIGKDNDWTLTIVRTDLGREIIEPDDRRRVDHRPARRRGPGRDRADAQAGREEPVALAAVGRAGRAPGPAREEEAGGGEGLAGDGLAERRPALSRRACSVRSTTGSAPVRSRIAEPRQNRSASRPG